MLNPIQPKETYWDHISEAVSQKAFQEHNTSGLISAEASSESKAIIDFKGFIAEYPEKIFPLIYQLRPEFQELFIEYYILEKSQSFIAEVHGQIQTRIWQNLRIIEQSVGALIILGTKPDSYILRPILERAGLERTECGSLTDMIVTYAVTQNYARVAERIGVPTPKVRKIFRPVIAELLGQRDIKAVAVGAYLRSLTHQVSLTGAGLSKASLARTHRNRNIQFTAPAGSKSSLFSFGLVEKLKDAPWYMFEILSGSANSWSGSAHRAEHSESNSDRRSKPVIPILRECGSKIFGKKPGQIFAPTDSDGELTFNYIFARSLPSSLVKGLTKVRGVSEMSAVYDKDGNFDHAVTVSHADVQKMMKGRLEIETQRPKLHDFVEILTGPAARYCGFVVKKSGNKIVVDVSFPTERHFLVTGDITSAKVLVGPAEKKAFWGIKF